MTRVLVVEDEDYRRAWFRETFPGAEITADVDEAIALLREREYAVVFLDHDLGTEPKAGRDVATWLIQHPDNNRAADIVVHSMNVVSADKMHRELIRGGRRVQRVPFSVLANIPVIVA